MTLDESERSSGSHRRWHRCVGFLGSSLVETIAQVVVSSLLLQLLPSTNGDCGIGWTQKNGLCYNLTSPINWRDAQQVCTSINGSLTNIGSSSQQNDIYKFLQEHSIYEAWIGLNKLQNQSEWLWVSGDAVTYINWANGEPNNQIGSEYCVHTYDPFLKGWNDENCNNRFSGLCQKRGNCSSSWTQKNGLCYLVTVPMSWSDARQACMSLNGSLTEIGSNNQENDIFQYLKSLDIKRAWIGLSRLQNSSEWIWDSGDAVTYHNWAYGEPNNVGGNENCVEITAQFAEGWNDKDCNAIFPGVCKKNENALQSTTPSSSQTEEPGSSISTTTAGWTLHFESNNFSLVAAIVIPLALCLAASSAIGFCVYRRLFCFKPRYASTCNAPAALPSLSDGEARCATVDPSPATRQHSEASASDFACYSNLVKQEDHRYAALPCPSGGAEKLGRPPNKATSFSDA